MVCKNCTHEIKAWNESRLARNDRDYRALSDWSYGTGKSYWNWNKATYAVDVKTTTRVYKELPCDYQLYWQFTCNHYDHRWFLWVKDSWYPTRIFILIISMAYINAGRILRRGEEYTTFFGADKCFAKTLKYFKAISETDLRDCHPTLNLSIQEHTKWPIFADFEVFRYPNASENTNLVKNLRARKWTLIHIITLSVCDSNTKVLRSHW